MTHLPEAWHRLVAALVERNIVRKRAMEDVLRRHRPTTETVEKVLIESGLVTRSQLLATKGEVFGLGTVDLNHVTLDPQVGRLLPQTMADRYGVVCFGRQGDTLLVAGAEPVDAIALDYLRMRSGFRVHYHVTLAGDIEPHVAAIYSGLDKSAQPSAPTRQPEVSCPVTAPHNPRPSDLFTEVEARGSTKRRVQVPGLSRPTAPAPAAIAPQPMPRPGYAVAASRATAFLPSRVAVAMSPSRHSATGTCAMCQSTRHLLAGDEERVALDRIFHAAVDRIGCEAMSLLVPEADGRSLFFKYALGPMAESIMDMVVPLDEASVAGWVLTHGQPAVVGDAGTDPRHNKSTDKALGFVTRDLVAVPVFSGGEIKGVLEGVNHTAGSFTEDDVNVLQIAAAQAAVVLYAANVAEVLRKAVVETVEMLVEIMDAHQTCSRAHAMNVAQVATALGREMGLDENTLEQLSCAGLLHDIGLSRTLAGDVRVHPGCGAEMLEKNPTLRHLVGYVGFHHERWDGEGTYGMREQAIPMGARILAVAEEWCEGQPGDETATRRYLEAFMERFGTAFDPDLREAFARVIDSAAQLRPMPLNLEMPVRV